MNTTTIHDLPVADLAAHPDNLRSDLADLRGLARSIKEGGVVEPLVVIPIDGGGHRVVAGHRRLAAAVEAGMDTVPCWVRDDLTGPADQVATMLVENMHREDLTPVDQAKGFVQLAMLGVSDTKAARMTGVGRTFVRKARAVADDQIAAGALAETPGLSFDQALAISEIVSEGDPADASRLADLAVNAPGRFEHVLSQIREDRAEARRRAERIDALQSDGVNVVDDDALRPPAARIRDLTSADTPGGEFVPLDPDGHASCPGHAVSLSPWDPDHVVYWCLDPASNGHRNRWGDRPRLRPAEDDEAERERKRQERRTVIANNKAWRAAEPVRRDYVRSLLARKRVPKGTLRYLVTELMADPEAFGRTGDDGMLGDLTNTKVPAGWGRKVGPALTERAADARLPLVLLAQQAADLEGAMGVHTWRHNDPRAARWLAYLAGTGYTLSDIEQQVVDSLHPADDDGPAHNDSTVADVVDLDDHQHDNGSDADQNATERERSTPVA